jgi:hypothetical protein
MELLMMKNMHRKYDGVHVYWKKSHQRSSIYLKCKTMFAEAKAASESK